KWIDPVVFQDALAACNLMPGPASTQLAIYCAWRLRGRRGALLGGLCFIVPGLIVVIALSALFLASGAPLWVRAGGAGAGAAVPAVAVNAGASLMPDSWRRASGHRLLWFAAFGAGVAGAVLLGAELVLVLLAAGLAGVVVIRRGGERRLAAIGPALAGKSFLGPLAVTALKVGALAFGGGFVIVPLMRGDAVGPHHWMTSGQFLDAVALGQITPGPVVQTVSAVGYAAAGVGGALLASLIAFTPSFLLVLGFARRFDRVKRSPDVQAFLAGAGPAAIGAIVGVAALLASELHHGWQVALLLVSLVALLVLRRGVVPVLIAAGVTGAVVGLAGAAVG
ncbi:MAG: chromate transporter, partial [Solirubrobacteraceae bacterium]|nr:chromate transporter [Solirubrobacteraceae bacterium]